MRDLRPDISEDLGFEKAFEVIDKDGRANLRRLTVEHIFKKKEFNYNLLEKENLEFTLKEKLYIAYAVVMRYAFKENYQTILAAEKKNACPNITAVARKTLQPVFEGDPENLPELVLDAMCYLDKHQQDGTLTKAIIEQYPHLDITAKPADLLRTRLRGNPYNPSTSKAEEMERARKHTAETAPALVRETYGIKTEDQLDTTRVGCPMLLAGQLREFINDAIDLDKQRKASESEEAD
jgi:hypothetical protein